MNPDSMTVLTHTELLRLVDFMAKRGHRRAAFDLLAGAVVPRLLEGLALIPKEDT